MSALQRTTQRVAASGYRLGAQPSPHVLVIDARANLPAESGVRVNPNPVVAGYAARVSRSSEGARMTCGSQLARSAQVHSRRSQMWQVLVVEDDDEVRNRRAAGIARTRGIEVLASVGTVGAASSQLGIAGLHIDLVLTDLDLPDGSGLEVIRMVRRLRPACGIMVMSMPGDEDRVLAGIEAGALGYVLKDASPDDIAATILELKAGASPISPMVARRVQAKLAAMKEQAPLQRTSNPAPAASPHDSPALSPREQKALELIARGFSYMDIARLEGISVNTVQSHIKNLYRKLSVNSRSEAVFEATRMGLLGR
jgi:DNA-binding NarL/FixJ family response regulator